MLHKSILESTDRNRKALVDSHVWLLRLHF